MSRAAAPLLQLVAALMHGCARDASTPAYEYFPDMIDSLAYESFSENMLMPDGKTMLAPPDGTIARGRTPLHFGPGKEEAKRAAVELTNPLQPSDARRARGEQLFGTFCSICHGSGGQGDGPLVPRFPAPPSLTAARAKAMADGQLFHVVTFGQGLMAGYRQQVLAPDRWNVVHYIRALQKGGKP